MERLEAAVSGVEQALRRAASMSPIPHQGHGPAAVGTLTAQGAPTWLQMVRQRLPRIMEALSAEQPDAADCALAARARQLTAERNRLLHQLRALGPALAEGRVPDAVATDLEELRRRLLRLVHDISHHHQRVNDLVYDGAWRDVGGSG